MGNENKINDNLETTSKFLPAELSDSDAKSDTYSLRKEFSKTRKNKDFLLYLVVAVFIGVFTFGAYYLGKYIYEVNINNEISIGEFEDLRLKELIDSAKKNASGLELARADLENLKIDKQNAILKIDEKYSLLFEKLYSEELSDEELEKSLSALKVKQKKQLFGVNKRYDSRINKKLRDISLIKKDIKKDDKVVQEGISESSAVVGNYNKINDIKMNIFKKSKEREIRLLKRYYDNYVRSIVLKYNPNFRSQKIKSILKESVVLNKSGYRFLNEYNNLLEKEGVLSVHNFKNFHERIKNNSILMNRLLRIPYKNSVKPTLKNIDRLTKSIVQDYDKLWNDLVLLIYKKNYIIKSYDYALDFILNEKPESGYIIDPRKLSNMFIHMNKVYKLTDGETAVIFRSDDEYIGKIKIYKKDSNGFRAKLISRMKGKKVKPFDKILLEKNVE